MSLTDPMQGNAVSLADANNPYSQNVGAVDSAMTSIVSSDYSILQRHLPDPLYYNDAFEHLVAETTDWPNKILAHLQSVPDIVMQYNDIINGMLVGAQTQAQALITNPNDSDALKLLGKDLDNLPGTFNAITEDISTIISWIGEFQDKLPDLSDFMTLTANRAWEEAIDFDPSYEDTFKAANGFFGRMADLVQSIQTNLPGVLQGWQTLQTDVNAAIADINKATTDKTSNNFNAVKADITDAITQWNAAYAQAGNLHLDPQANTASL